MKKIIILLAILCIFTSCGVCKYHHNEYVYLVLSKKPMFYDASIDSILWSLSHGSDSIKAAVIGGIYVKETKTQYYELKFFNENGNSFVIEDEPTSLFMRRIKMFPEYMIYPYKEKIK